MPEPGNQSLSMIERLVGFDTTSHKSNLQLIEFRYWRYVIFFPMKTINIWIIN